MLEMEPVKRSQLTTQVIDRIKQYIESNQLQAGAQLPGERELARTLGVSRNVTREAIRALQATGILDIRPGNGVFVADFNYGDITAHLSFAIGRQPREFRHWVEARAVMERAIVELATPRITPAQIERLEASIRQLDRAESFEADMAADLDFHRCLVEVTGNPVLMELMSFLAQFFQEARRLKGSRFGGVDEHRAVIAAIKRKDAKEAGRLMEEHVKRWNQVG